MYIFIELLSFMPLNMMFLYSIRTREKLRLWTNT